MLDCRLLSIIRPFAGISCIMQISCVLIAGVELFRDHIQERVGQAVQKSIVNIVNKVMACVVSLG